MKRIGYSLLTIIFLIFLISCRSTRPAVQPSGGEPDAGAYIEKYKDLAVSEMKRTGIPASITLAQGMIESDYGRSSLARNGNNHFGIKCHDDWTGPTIYHHDDRRNECFRKYSRPEDSFYDHSDFLKSGSRYVSLFDLSPTDYKGWARGLKKAGYATNPDYANMLIRKIEEDNLYYFDRGYAAISEIPTEQLTHAVNDSLKLVNRAPVVNTPASNESPAIELHTSRVMENNRVQYIIVKDGETVESIEKDFQLLKWELTKYNELNSGFTPFAGQILYLQPKRDKAEPGKETYMVSEGETMYAISQKYAIKVRKLFEYNRMTEGEEPVAGQKLWLRTMKPVN